MTRNLRAEVDASHLEQLALAEKRGVSLASPRAGHGKVAPAKPALELDAQCRARSVDDIASHLERLAAPDKSMMAVGRMNRQARKAERVNGDGEQIAGTGLTALKFRVNGHPLAKLIDEHKLVPEAVTAADEIHTAFHAIASRMMIRPGCLERIDGRGRGDMPWPAKISRSVSNYQAFARHWTKRANLGDPMLEVLIAVVIDERSIRDVSEGVSVGHRRFGHIRIKRAVIAGLQDYAARAGFVTGGLATRWQEEAERVFPVLPAAARIPESRLRQAVEAARGL